MVYVHAFALVLVRTRTRTVYYILRKSTKITKYRNRCTGTHLYHTNSSGMFVYGKFYAITHFMTAKTIQYIPFHKCCHMCTHNYAKKARKNEKKNEWTDYEWCIFVRFKTNKNERTYVHTFLSFVPCVCFCICAIYCIISIKHPGKHIFAYPLIIIKPC